MAGEGELQYVVSGTASKASLTYSNSQGGTEMPDVRVPWTKNFAFKGADLAYVSAQNLGETGTIVCQIKVDGKEWRKAVSSGEYSICRSSGTVGRE